APEARAGSQAPCRGDPVRSAVLAARLDRDRLARGTRRGRGPAHARRLLRTRRPDPLPAGRGDPALAVDGVAVALGLGVVPRGGATLGPRAVPVPRREPAAPRRERDAAPPARAALGSFAARGVAGRGALRRFEAPLPSALRRGLDRRAVRAHVHARGAAARRPGAT